VQAHIARLGLDVTHFHGRGWARGKSFPEQRATPIHEVLVQGRRTQSHNLKLRLIRLGLKTPECETCHNTEWMGKSIPIELDHINGDHLDNRLENLRILCANCHAQTPTYSGRNRKAKAPKPLRQVSPTREKGLWPTSEALRQLVQEKPVRVLAQEIGVTDVAVTKRCKKLGIPTPPRGYWAKVRAGLTPP
jgi:hypothetical protein